MDKSLTQLIEETVEEVCFKICNEYCKWPEKFNAEKEGCELADSEYCQNCPLNDLQ